MALAYGRDRRASSGPGIQYDAGPAQGAGKFLEPDEASQYQSHLATMGAGRAGRGTGRNTWSGSRQHVSKLLKRDRLSRAKADREASDLRNVAATRALGEFRKAGMKTSKPWLRTASEGLISGQSINAPIDASKLYWTRKKGVGAKDRMTKNQKKRVGDIAKYTNFQYDPIGLSGKGGLGRPGDAPPVSGSTAGPVGGTTNPIAPPAQSGTAQPIDLGNGDIDNESGTAFQDLIDKLKAESLGGG